MAGTLHALPFVFSMGLAAIAQSTARIHDYEDTERHVHHLQRRTMGGGRSKSLPPLLFPVSDSPLTALSEKLYTELGRRHPIANLTTATPAADFYKFNSTNYQELAQILHSVFELRLLDTQASVRRARQMLDLVQTIAPAARY